jgi:protein-S-isoprenylcysteine O-methyltransferase Ste14
MTSHESGPRIRIPPPAIYLAGFLAGLLAQRLVPVRLGSAGVQPLRLVGAGLGLAGIGLSLSAMVHMLRHRTTILPFRPATSLLVTGPFHLSRNPIYLGLTATYAGLAAWMAQVWPLVLLPVVLFALTRLVIEREEEHLAGRFGAGYHDYRRAVRRWL